MNGKERYQIDIKRLRMRERKRKGKVWAGRILVLFAVFLLCFCIFGISIVEGDSMRPAYKEGDLVLFLRILPRGVTYGDVVILEDPEGKEVIKRIAGLAGDTIAIDDTGRFWRNGSLVSEQDIIYSAASGGIRQSLTVPKNACFYLGDNRPVSKDSRQNGCAGKDKIRGKVLLTLRR